MTPTCRIAAGALAAAGLLAAAAPATASPSGPAQVMAMVRECQRLVRMHGPKVSWVFFRGPGKHRYRVPAVDLGPSQGPEDALIETIENAATSPDATERPVFTLVCLNGKVGNDPNGGVHLYPDGPKTLNLNEVIGKSLRYSQWLKPPLRDICVKKAPAPLPASPPLTGPFPAGLCWPWIGSTASVYSTKILHVPIPYEPSRVYNYMIYVWSRNSPIPVDPQIINH